jgi:methionine biosynthesis protein MetW
VTPAELRAAVDWGRTARRDRALDRAIIDAISPGESVLDLGCGTGDLLSALKREKGVRERGIELEASAVSAAIARHLAVIQGDLSEGLEDLPDGSWDVVVLNQVVPVVREPKALLAEALRIGKRVIVTIPNFAWWPDRLHLFITGRLPVNPALPYQWHDTPNVRVVTVRDFRALAADLGATIIGESFAALPDDGSPRPVHLLPNLRASLALFVLEGGKP